VTIDGVTCHPRSPTCADQNSTLFPPTWSTRWNQQEHSREPGRRCDRGIRQPGDEDSRREATLTSTASGAYTPIVVGARSMSWIGTVGKRFAPTATGHHFGGSHDWNGRGIDDLNPSVEHAALVHTVSRVIPNTPTIQPPRQTYVTWPTEDLRSTGITARAMALREQWITVGDISGVYVRFCTHISTTLATAGFYRRALELSMRPSANTSNADGNMSFGARFAVP